MIALFVQPAREKRLLVLLLLIGIAGGVLAFTPAYFSNLNVLIGVCLLPFASMVVGPKRNNILYVLLMIVAAALAAVYSIRICYFFSLAFYFLWLIELFVGRLGVVILFLLVFMSPFFIQVVAILGFPLRLLLSEHARNLLNLAGVNVHVEGNMMMLNGATFRVDEACMGLNMLVMSLLMGVFVLAYRNRLSKTTLGLYSTGVFFFVAFILNLVTNLIRIIVLVFFRIPPEDPMHHIIGILCLIVYVIIPLHFFSAWLVRMYGKPKTDYTSVEVRNTSKIVLMVILPVIVLFAGTTLEDDRHARTAHADIRFGDATVERMKDGISKLSTADLLIYVKVIPEFFTGEHTPLMCWEGSGYKFSCISVTSVEGIAVYKGILVKEGKSLHTAWWYSNGQVDTISQLDWRTRMFKGEPGFCLVNVTAEDETTLVKSIHSMFAGKALAIRVGR